jgi:hypothetical protein
LLQELWGKLVSGEEAMIDFLPGAIVAMLIVAFLKAIGALND